VLLPIPDGPVTVTITPWPAWASDSASSSCASSRRRPTNRCAVASWAIVWVAADGAPPSARRTSWPPARRAGSRWSSAMHSASSAGDTSGTSALGGFGSSSTRRRSTSDAVPSNGRRPVSTM
jgi:hypothetical protein